VNVVYWVALPLVHRDGEGDLSPGAGHVPPLRHHHGAAQVPRRSSGKLVSPKSYKMRNFFSTTMRTSR
jgi:hypothetical protein